jgi:hypothetical protein
VPFSVTTFAPVSTLISDAFTVSSAASLAFTAFVIPESDREHATVMAKPAADSTVANLCSMTSSSDGQEPAES